MHMASMRESQDSDRFLVNTQVQSHALLCQGFGTSVPFIDNVASLAKEPFRGNTSPTYTEILASKLG